MPQQVSLLYLIDKLAFGGTPLQVMELALHLDPGKFRRHFVVLSHAVPELRQRLTDQGVTCDLIGRSNWKQLRAWRDLHVLHRLLRRRQPAIVHALLPTSNVLAALVGKWAGVPVVISSHRDLGGFDGAGITRVNDWVDRHLVDCVLANSEAVRQAVLERTRLQPGRVKVLYNGVDAEALRRADRGAAKRQELGVGEREILIAVVANIRPAKGHRDALLAFEPIARRFPQTRLLLCGFVSDAGLFRELQQLVANAQMERQVWFMDSRKDIPELMHAIDILLMPSHSEGFSNAVLEAMAAGKPVIASAVGGNCEQVVDRVTGLLTPAGDPGALAHALSELVASPAQRRRMGEAAARRVDEKFSVHAMAAAHENLYDELIRRSNTENK